MFELNIIKSTNILSDKDFEILSHLTDELKDTMQKKQVFRTETEMEISVLNDIKFPTTASKYWQAIREQSTMFENLVMLSFDYRRNEVQINRINKNLETCDDIFDRQELEIDLDECIFKKANMAIVAKDRIREISLWSKFKTELDNGSFDTKDVNTHQLVSYATRFLIQASNAPRDMPLAEANNLKGQLITAIKELDTRGLLQSVLADLPPSVMDKLNIEILPSIGYSK